MHIIGIDEAGRGPLAGPIVAAAVAIPEGTELPKGVRDSKKIGEKEREELGRILRKILNFSISGLSPAHIDSVGIERANTEVMERAATGLLKKLAKNAKSKSIPARILVDGRPKKFQHLEATFIVQGESAHLEIAAASILAKTHRDSILRDWDKKHPEYGFASHKGYGTKSHIETILRLGPTPIHRMSFLTKILGKG